MIQQSGKTAFIPCSNDRLILNFSHKKLSMKLCTEMCVGRYVYSLFFIINY